MESRTLTESCIKCGDALTVVRERPKVLVFTGNFSCDLCHGQIRATSHLEDMGLLKWEPTAWGGVMYTILGTFFMLTLLIGLVIAAIGMIKTWPF